MLGVWCFPSLGHRYKALQRKIQSVYVDVCNERAIESEWGPMVLELRFKANGMVYQGMLSADAEDEGKFSADGKFSVRGDRLVMTIMEDTSERRFEVKDDVLTLEDEGEKIRFKKVEK
jgi:hypothetical protein